MGVRPQLEIWGSSVNLSRTSEAAFVAADADHPDACLLLDVYHLYRGGSGFESLRLLNGAAMHVFHINDYPAEPAREELTDAHRVYPGDGVAPMSGILRTLHETGFRGTLSLELFNREYWKQEPLSVARTGLEKTRAAVERALG
jgi:sugar phosphate isomerase/epimerase